MTRLQGQPIPKSYRDWNTSWPQNGWEISECQRAYHAAQEGTCPWPMQSSVTAARTPPERRWFLLLAQGAPGKAECRRERAADEQPRHERHEADEAPERLRANKYERQKTENENDAHDPIEGVFIES